MRYLTFLILCCFSFKQVQAQADSARLHAYIDSLIAPNNYRNYLQYEELNRAANFIKNQFAQLPNSYVWEQTYLVEGKTYRNIVCSLDTARAKRVVIGAHYDVCGFQPGADDNASGVAGLLELCRLWAAQTHPFRTDFVAFTLEEPPFFGTPDMGSYRYAEELRNRNVPVLGMVCFEMIGYYDTTEFSQQFPLPAMYKKFGTRGDFIALVNQKKPGKFTKHFTKHFTQNTTIKAIGYNSPAGVLGVDFSDHASFWQFNYDALMITNTAFFRNTHYHALSDSAEKLDYARMAQVINAAYAALSAIQ